MSRRGSFRFVTAGIAAVLITGTVSVLASVAPAAANGTPTWTAEGDGGGSQSSGGVNYLYDDSFNGAIYSVVTVTDTNGGITAPVIQSVTNSAATGFTCSSGPLPPAVVGTSNATPWPENAGDTTYKCLLTVAPGPANGDDSGVPGTNGTMHSVTFAETDNTGTYTDTITFDILPPPLGALSGTNSWTGAAGTAGAQLSANDTTYGNPAVADFSAGGPSSTLLTNVSASGGTIYTGANPTDSAGGTAAVVEVNPGSFWTGNQGSSGSQDVDQGTASTSGQKWGLNTETVTTVDVNQSCSPSCLVTTGTSVPASFPPSVGATGITVSGTDIPTGDTVTTGSGTGNLDLTTPPTGTVGGTGETITFSWASATSPPPSGFLTSTTTVASETSYKSGADPIGICPPTPAMIEAGIPFCQERFDYSGSGPTVGTPDVEYAGQGVPTTTSPTVALSSGSGAIGSSIGITDATNACPATIGAGSASQNFFDGTYNAAGTSITGTYNCWYGRAGDATPVTVTVDGAPATVTPTNPSNGDVSEAFYDVDGPNDTSTYDGAGTITLMSVAGGSNTVSCGASSAGTAAAPYSDLIGDAVSGTDIPLGTEVTNVVNSATHTCSFTLSNAATATPAAETLTFYAVTLNPPQLNASFTIPAGTPTGPQTVEVCEATTPNNGFDWEFGVQSMAPAGSLQYVSGNSGPTEICSTQTVDVSQASSSTSSTPTAANIALSASNSDGATVTGSAAGVDPTGTVSFYACAEGVDPCTPSGTPFDTESLSGTSNPATVTSATVTPNSPGTWCFAAVYSGDGNYTGSSDQSSDECYTVSPVSSSTTSTPTAANISLGAGNSDGATVTGSLAGIDPTGTVSFYACAENVDPCTPSGTPFDTETLSGTSNPATVTSATFTPDSAGTWCFAAVYSGDGNYTGSSDQSSDECYTVSSVGSSTTSTPAADNISLGAGNSDGSTVTGSVSGVDPTGTVSFYACSVGVDPCVPSGTPFDTEALSGTSNPDTVASATFTPDSQGTWCFAAVYSGDGNYTGSSDQGSDECYTVSSVGSSTTSSPAAGNISLGAGNSDGATVTGSVNGVDPTGTVSFYACAVGVDPCVPSGSPFDTESLNGTSNPATVNSATVTPDSAGTWCFAAVYSGDGNYTGSSDQGTDECYTVSPVASSTTSTPAADNISLGAGNSDGVTVTGSLAGIDPTGTVSFYACGENVEPCTPSGTPFDTEALSGTSNPETVASATFTPDSAGTWCFAAVYSGDGNYTGSSDQSSDECYTVSSVGSSTVSEPSSSTAALDGPNTDGVVVTGDDSAGNAPYPTGQVTFYTCAVNVDPCTSATWTQLGNPATLGVGADNTNTATSASFTNDATGTWCFAAVYSGDGNYGASSDHTSDECYTVGQATTSTLSAPLNTTITEGQANIDQATVTGNAASTAPTGTVTFYQCGPTSTPTPCVTGTEVGGAVNLTTSGANTATASSPKFTPSASPTAIGYWCFRAVYSGDGNYFTSSDNSSVRECFYVTGPLVVTTASPLPSGTKHVHYSVRLTAAGGTSPYKWSHTGSLDGLTLSSSGLLSGSPSRAGTFTFTAKVKDSSTPHREKASKSLTFTINP